MQRYLIQIGLVVTMFIGLPAIVLADDKQPKFSVSTVMENLQHPWSLTFLPDGSMLLTERPGRLHLIRQNGEQKQIDGVPAVFNHKQGGLFEAVPHPNFKDNQLIYLTYAHREGKLNGTRLARAQLTDDKLLNLEILFTTQPLKKTPVHYGGRMVFLPDGTLLLTSGDGFDYREDAQKLDNHLGKVLRLTAAGTTPKDNPFTNRADALGQIWTLGHRNPQGIVYDETTDTVYMHEHGPLGGDELNILEAGNNYGWPIATYGKDYSGAKISPYTEYEGTEQPLVYWVPSIAPAGMAIYRGDLFPDWNGDLLVAALAAQLVMRIDLENGKVVQQIPLFADEAKARIRDVRVDPDGAIYLLTDMGNNDKLLKITPAK